MAPSVSSPEHSGEPLRWEGRHLYPVQDPVGATTLKLLQYPRQPQTLYFFPSPLLLYGFAEFLAALPERCAVILYEHQPELRHLSQEAWAPFLQDARVRVLEKDEEAAVQTVLQGWKEGRFRRVMLLRVTGGVLLHSRRYQDILAKLENEIQAWWKNRLTSIRLGPLWIRNLLVNLHRLATAPALDTWQTGRPILVCGAGSSLEAVLPLAAAHRERFFLLVVDTALPVVLAAGLKPDAIVAVEAQFHNLGDFLGARDSGIPVLADLTSYPRALDVCAGPVAFFNSDFGSLALLERLEAASLRPPLLPPLGSVGVTAVAVALRLTKGPVWLAGLDFSFQHGKSHATEAPFLQAARYRQTRLQAGDFFHTTANRPSRTAAGKQGQAVQTTSILETYASVLAQLIQTERRVFDLGPAGLPLGPVLPLANWQSQLQSSPRLPPWTTGDTPAAVPLAGAARLANFLQTEADRLQTCLDQFDRVNATGQGLDELVSSLNALDYLYFSFPDTLPMPRPDSAFLSRVLVSLHVHLPLLRSTP